MILLSSALYPSRGVSGSPHRPLRGRRKSDVKERVGSEIVRAQVKAKPGFAGALLSCCSYIQSNLCCASKKLRNGEKLREGKRSLKSAMDRRFLARVILACGKG